MAKCSINFNDAKLNALSQACTDLQLPINNGYVKLNLKEDNKGSIKALIQSYTNVTIPKVVITQINPPQKANIYTYYNVRLVPELIEIDTDISYIVTLTYGSKNYSNPW